MKKIGKIIAILLTAAIAVTMFVIPTSAAGISSAKTFTEGAVLNWSVPAKKSAVCYLKMTFSDSGKAKFSIGSQKTTAKSKYQILDSKGNKKYSGKISALAGKEVSVNKGTYYLKLTLQKGQYVKKLKYTFTGKSPTKKTTGDWLTGYTLTDNEIKQINKALKRFYGMDKFFFNEGEINEEKAINWIYRIGDIVDPYNGNDITVNGKLTASGSEIGIYLDSGDITVNSGADLTAVGNGITGIAVNDGNGSVTIKRDAKVSAVGGAAGAIDAIVKNAITGTAWTDKSGTTGETAIEVNANRELGDTYKKVQFPASQYTITYDLSGGTLDGQTGTVTKKVDAGTVITLPAPVRDGYTFDYWEGSKYNAGDKYTVTADHTFKAVWKTADKGGGSDSGDKGGSSKKGVKTGDGNRLGAWIVLLAAALAGTAGMVFARKKKGK